MLQHHLRRLGLGRSKTPEDPATQVAILVTFVPSLSGLAEYELKEWSVKLLEHMRPFAQVVLEEIGVLPKLVDPVLQVCLVALGQGPGTIAIRTRARGPVAHGFLLSGLLDSGTVIPSQLVDSVLDDG